jgi:hypothetical protein
MTCLPVDGAAFSVRYRCTDTSPCQGLERTGPKLEKAGALLVWLLPVH